MDWISGMQKAIAYIEEHITEEIDYAEVARQAYSSPYHFQRVFSILCGYTLGEYIRNRRLSLAGTELVSSKAKVIDVALKYGYDSPDSFTKSFRTFHGITPSQARMDGAKLRSFSRLSIKILLEGGTVMDYRIEKKEKFTLVGYKRRFTGSLDKRLEQEGDFYMSTRFTQYALEGMARDCDTNYNVMTNFADDGYDFYIAAKLSDSMMEYYEYDLGEDAKRFEKIEIPAGLYLICETERCEYPTMKMEDLRRKAVSEWLPSSGYELTEAPELSVYHWYCTEGYDPNSRYVELWLPITKA